MRYRKQAAPRPNRADALWRGCMFAAALGWDRGPVVTGMRATPDDQFRQRGTIGGSISGTYSIRDFGWALNAGTSEDNIIWDDIGGRFDLGVAEPQITVAALVRPDTNSANEHLEVLTKRNTDGVANNGWNLELRNTLTDPWAFEICNGVTENRAQSTVDGTLNRSDMLIAAFNDLTDRIKIWVNGVLSADSATTITLPDNNEPIAALGFADNNALHILPGGLGMAAVWRRELATSEIARLYTDPFCMWHRGTPGAGDLS